MKLKMQTHFTFLYILICFNVYLRVFWKVKNIFEVKCGTSTQYVLTQSSCPTVTTLCVCYEHDICIREAQKY